MGGVGYDFSGRVALVVGASRGTGAGTARAGASVVLASIHQEAIDAVAASIEDTDARGGA